MSNQNLKQKAKKDLYVKSVVTFMKEMFFQKTTSVHYVNMVLLILNQFNKKFKTNDLYNHSFFCAVSCMICPSSIRKIRLATLAIISFVDCLLKFTISTFYLSNHVPFDFYQNEREIL